MTFAAGCNGSLVGHDYQGDPLFSIQARLYSYQDLRFLDSDIRVSLFWSPSGKTDVPLEELIEQVSVSTSIRLPNVTTVHIYHPPLDHYLRREDPRYGVALILVYTDRDGNGRLTPSANPSELLGGGEDTVLLYAPYLLEATQSPTDQILFPGFYLAHLPQSCGFHVSEEQIDSLEDCEVSLGAACNGNASCGGSGKCLKEMNWTPFPGKYCVQPYSETGCRPSDGVKLIVYEGPRTGVNTYWFKGCRSDGECRQQEGYECDMLQHTCLPIERVWLILKKDFSMQRFCVDTEDDP